MVYFLNFCICSLVIFKEEIFFKKRKGGSVFFFFFFVKIRVFKKNIFFLFFLVVYIDVDFIFIDLDGEFIWVFYLS